MRIIAVDPETENTSPWSIQWCSEAGKASMVLTEDTDKLVQIKDLLESQNTLTVVHNALFDIPVLSLLGIIPNKVADTMIMAYLLGEVAINLKTLAFRYANMEMRTYTEVVAGATKEKALPYLERVLSRTWEDPCAVVEWKGDKQHVRFPQNITTKIKKLLKKHDSDSTIDLREKWIKMEGREQVEQEIGIMEIGWLSDIPLEDAVNYACKDPDATYRIYEPLWKRIQEAGLEEVFWVDMGCLPMLTDMMENGALIDKDYFTKLEGEFNEQLRETQEEAEREAGFRFNIGSPPQVAQALYKLGVFGMPDQSTGSKYLDRLSSQHKIVRIIQRYREISTLITRYIRALPRSAGDDGRVRTRYSVTTAESGRLASRDPNLQNIPVRTERGRQIKRGFIAPKGKWLVAFDYSQIEMRIAAHESQDAELLRIYNNGGDIHEKTRFMMFGGKPDDIQRISAKTVNFRTLYLTSAPGLLNSMFHAGITNYTVHDCEKFINIFWSTYPGLTEWMARLKSKTIREGKVVDMFGRIRYIPEVNSVHFWIREEGLRKAVNHPMQSGASGILKIAMKNLKPLYSQWGERVKPILHVHDEVIWEIEDGMLEEVIPPIKKIMEEAVTLSVSTPVEVEIGLNLTDKWEVKLC